MVLTHAIHGHAEYVRASQENIFDGLRASSSIPVLTRQPVLVNGEPYFDGGVADALPIQWAAAQPDVTQLMVIRTRPKTILKPAVRVTSFWQNI